MNAKEWLDTHADALRRVKLIASDLDGTLLQYGARNLHPETCGLISKLMDKGLLFFAASGRQYTNLQRLFWPIHERIGYLCENGAVSFWQGEMLSHEVMEAQLARELISTGMARENTEVLVSGVMVGYVQPQKPAFADYMRQVVGCDIEVVPDLLQVAEPSIKISFHEPGGIKDEGFWQAAFGDRCTVVSGGPVWLDTMPAHVNKGFGLTRILERLGIAPDECLALGDNDNDLEMLRLVGVPATVTGGKPLVRETCAFETDTVEALLEQIGGMI